MKIYTKYLYKENNEIIIIIIIIIIIVMLPIILHIISTQYSQ
jgi:hypothetical protein